MAKPSSVSLAHNMQKRSCGLTVHHARAVFEIVVIRATETTRFTVHRRITSFDIVGYPVDDQNFHSKKCSYIELCCSDNLICLQITGIPWLGYPYDNQICFLMSNTARVHI